MYLVLIKRRDDVKQWCNLEMCPVDKLKDIETQICAADHTRIKLADNIEQFTSYTYADLKGQKLDSIWCVVDTITINSIPIVKKKYGFLLAQDCNTDIDKFPQNDYMIYEKYKFSFGIRTTTTIATRDELLTYIKCYPRTTSHWCITCLEEFRNSRYPDLNSGDSVLRFATWNTKTVIPTEQIIISGYNLFDGAESNVLGPQENIQGIQHSERTSEQKS